jgi:hypothetical protein
MKSLSCPPDFRVLVWVLVIALVAAVVAAVSIVDPGINGYERAMFPDMVFGNAHKPYVYRTLVPSTIRALQAVVPQTIRNGLVETVDQQAGIASMFERLGWETEYAIEYGLVVIILFVSLIGFIGAVQYLYEGLYGGPKGYGRQIGLIAAVGLLPLLKYYNYIYDFPQLFLITLALGLLVRRNWSLYLVVFVFCCFNKETSILLVMVFFLYYWGNIKTDRTEYMKLLIVQLALFVLIKGILTYIYHDNPGSFIEFHLYDYNLIRLRKIKPFALLLWGGGVSFLLFYQWLKKPKFLRVSLMMLLPLVGLTLFLGFIDEWRDYFEVYPVLVLLAAHTVGKLAGLSMEEAARGEIPELL